MSFFKSRLAPIVMGLVGLGAVAALVHHAGVENIWATLARGWVWFPFVVILELAFFGCTVAALRVLYGEDRKKVPVGAFVRTGLISYAVMGLLPAGRAAAEAGRAVMLAKYCSAARATAAAVKLQTVSLFANASISVVATIGVYIATGLSIAFWLILGNFAITFTLGILFILGSRGRLGTKLGKRFPKFAEMGAQFDDKITDGADIPFAAFAIEFTGRCFQVLQNAFLVLAVGGMFGMIPALCSEALHLIGAAAGELIPAQLGATEAAFKLLAKTLSLSPADALSIALIHHCAQIIWIIVGSLTLILTRAQTRQPALS